MELFVFGVFALAALASAIVVVFHKNPVYSTMSLVVTLLSTAGLFVLLGSPFLAALQVLLYTGAILVLFLFVIMLLNIQKERTFTGRTPGQTAMAFFCAAFLCGIVAWLLVQSHGGDAPPPISAESSSLTGIADSLFTTYLVPFEIVGLLLLVAVVAASWVAKRPDASETGSDGGGA